MKVEEHRRTINQQLGMTGAATAGILGVTGVAGVAIAITAIAFGLVQGTVDNVTTGMLYSLAPNRCRRSSQTFAAPTPRS